MKERSVTCPVCHQSFFRSEEEYVEKGSRFVHKACLSDKDKKKIIVNSIHDKIKRLCGVDYSQRKVQKQINDYLKEGKTEIGILKTLEYWYDILNNDPKRANGGIGIVGYVYGDAMNYWQEVINNRNLNSNIDTSEKKEEVVITPTPIRKPKKFKLFDIR